MQSKGLTIKSGNTEMASNSSIKNKSKQIKRENNLLFHYIFKNQFKINVSFSPKPIQNMSILNISVNCILFISFVFDLLFDFNLFNV